MCSGSEAGSYLRLIDFVYHSTLGLRVIKKRRRRMFWLAVHSVSFAPPPFDASERDMVERPVTRFSASQTPEWERSVGCRV